MSTAAPPRPKKVRPEQARALLKAETEVAEAKRALERAKQRREEVRERLADAVEPGKELTVAGITIKRLLKESGRRFRLNEFLAKHKLTKQMEPFVTEPTPYEIWMVKEPD